MGGTAGLQSARRCGAVTKNESKGHPVFSGVLFLWDGWQTGIAPGSAPGHPGGLMVVQVHPVPPPAKAGNTINTGIVWFVLLAGRKDGNSRRDFHSPGGFLRVVSSVGRASAFQAECHGFEARTALQGNECEMGQDGCTPILPPESVMVKIHRQYAPLAQR